MKHDESFVQLIKHFRAIIMQINLLARYLFLTVEVLALGPVKKLPKINVLLLQSVSEAANYSWRATVFPEPSLSRDLYV